ncbi:MAG: DUF1571 domain-containing protein [Planctomycetota bacterium]|nr:MAG: DUF1571 domain-containing protein [Planctomycetota bacterium]
MLCTERCALAWPAARAAFVVFAWMATSTLCAAEFPQQTQSSAASVRGSAYRPQLPDSDVSDHPLTPVIDYAHREQKFLRQNVRDFTCRLVKRERIGHFLQDVHFIDMQVREGVYQNNQVVQPLSIYLHFLAPRDVVDRRVIYIEGQNDGKMLVRNGGRHFEYVVATIDPNGENARQETLVPVTEIGFNRLLDKMIAVLERHRQADPTGENTRAQRITGAKINDRSCTVIRITHPRRMDQLEFHLANVFVDDALHVPVRVDYSDWPRREGDKPGLIAEYTYTQLQLNVDLPENTFDRSRLRSR